MAGKKKNSSKALPQDPFEDMGKMDWLDPKSEDATQADAIGTAELSNAGGNSETDAAAAGTTTPESKAERKSAAEGAAMPEDHAESAEEVKALESPGNDKVAARPKKGRPKGKKKTVAKRSAKPEESTETPEVASEAISAITEAVTAEAVDESLEAAETKEFKSSAADKAASRPKERQSRAKQRADGSDEGNTKQQTESAGVAKETPSELDEAVSASIDEELVEVEGATFREAIARDEVDPGVEELEPSTQDINPFLEELIATIDGEMEAAFGSDPMVEESPEEVAEAIEEQHIIFELAGTEYAVYITNVIEIGPPLHVTPVPNVPAWVQGVVNLRGDVVSVVDLRSFLGMQAMSYRQSSRMLVARTHQEDLTVGLIVDRVSGIRYLDIDRFGAPTAEIEDQIAPYLRGTYEHEGHLLVVLDLDRLLRSTEMRQFEPV